MAVSIDQFGKSLVASGLLTAEEVKALWTALPANDRPKDGETFSSLLIKQGRLSPFQAQELLSGGGTPLVLNQYVLLSKIGAGGMGQVFKAQHRKMKRLAAIKLLPAALTKDEGAVKRFQREVEAAAKLTHPNIVQTYDADECRGIHFMVMECVDGQDLSALVKQNGPLPVNDAVDYILQAARGLAFAHAEGVVHRDIKPANLLLDKKGVVKILDMGLARIDDGNTADHQLTNTGAVMGTVDYMPPEQANDTCKADARSDVYSLGCSLYRLLTGESVFGGETVVQKIMAHMGDPIPSLQSKRPDCPAEIDRIFQKMLAKRPDDRYQQAAQVVAELEAWRNPGATTSFSSPSAATNDPALSQFFGAMQKSSSGASPSGSQTMPVNDLTEALGNRPLKSLSGPEATLSSSHAEIGTDPKSQVVVPLTGVKPSPTVPKHKSGGKGGKKPPVKLIAAGAAGFLFVLLGVILVIKNDKGETVAEVKVADGNTAEVKPPAGGSVQVKPDGTIAAAAPKGTAAQPQSVPTTPAVVATAAPSTASLAASPAAVVYLDDLPEKSVAARMPPKKAGKNSADFNELIANFGFEPTKHSLAFHPLPELATDKHQAHVDYEIAGTYARFQATVLCRPTRRPPIFAEVWGDGKLLWKSDDLVPLKPSGAQIDVDVRGVRELSLRLRTENSTQIGNVLWIDPRLTPVADSKSQISNLNSSAADAPPLAVFPFDAATATKHQEAWAKYLGVPVEFTNGLGMKFRLIPPGEFQMGLGPEFTDEELTRIIAPPKGLDAGFARCRPAHPVRITRPFYLEVEELTAGRFRDVVGQLRPEMEQEPNKPLQSHVAWPDAIAFCNKLSEREGMRPAYRIEGEQVTPIDDADGYRLPTEAQWEFACRAGTDTLWHFGHDGVGKDFMEKFSLPNPFGLVGLYGGVSEWCWDACERTPYSPAVLAVRDDPRQDTGTYRIQRGGSQFAGGGSDRNVINSFARLPSDGGRYNKTKHAFCGFGRVVLPIAVPASPQATGLQPPTRSLSQIERLLSDDYEWSAPESLGPVVNAGNWNVAPTLSDDQLCLIALNSFGTGDKRTGLYEYRRQTITEPWSAVKQLSDSNQDYPSLDSAGLMLFSKSEGAKRADGKTNRELVVRTRTSRDTPWGPVTPLATLNTLESEDVPVISPDGLTLVFGASNRPGSLGGIDLWISHRADLQAGWGTPVSLGSNVNSVKDERAAQILGDNKTILLSRNQELFLAAPDAHGAYDLRPVSLPPSLKTHKCWLTPDGATLYLDNRSASEQEEGAGEIRLIRRVPKTPVAATASTSKSSLAPNFAGVYLDELKETSFHGLLLQKAGTEQFANEWQSAVKRPETPPAHGLIFHPKKDDEARLTYDLGGRYTSFEAVAHCASDRQEPLYVELIGDGRSLARSVDLTTVKADGAALTADVRGVKELKLVIDARKRTFASHVALAHARLSTSLTSVSPSTRPVEIPPPTATPVGPIPPLAKAPFDAAQAKAHQQAWAKHLGTEVVKPNSIGMQMTLIPPGEFQMGSSDADIALALKIAEVTKLDEATVKRIQEERPQHTVRITQPFRLAAHEVTIGQFAKFVEQAKYKTQAEEFGGNSYTVKSEEVKPDSLKLTWRTPGQSVTDDSPVTQVSWNDTVEFCNWLSVQEQLTPCYQRDGDTWTLLPKANGYRLPTEAEWEYACRAGTATQFWFGDDWKEHDKFGWSNKNAGNGPHAVGLLSANPFGLYDMHGNVWEWCQDWYDGKWYEESPQDDPLGPSRASNRVFRGGSWSNMPGNSRSSSRGISNGLTPSHRGNHRGFRPALSSVGAPSATASVTTSTPPVVTPPPVAKPSGPQPPLAVAPFDAAQAKAHQQAWAKHLGTEVVKPNSVGMQMTLIPPGEFLMGSSDEDIKLALKIAEEAKLDENAVKRIQTERPQHTVRITKPFRLAAHEVTIGQFAKFVEQAKYKTQAEEFGGNSGTVKLEEVNPDSLKLNWRTPGQPVTDDSPVTQVSWNDAVAFCNWLSEQEKLEPYYQRDADNWTLLPKANGYRLPTEAEWEYACRAGTPTQYSFGDDWKELDKYGWSNKNAGGRPHAVGSLPANPFGLYDLHGNVWEWCQDWYYVTWYQNSPQDDPTGPSGVSVRVNRGGGWDSMPASSRSSYRHHTAPSIRFYHRGFRPVLGALGVSSSTASVTPQPAVAQEVIYLDDLAETSSYGSFLAWAGTQPFVKAWKEGVFRGTGEPPAHGLILHPREEDVGRIVYDLGGRYTSFKATVRCGHNRSAPLFIEVVGDDRSLIRSVNLTTVKEAGFPLVVDVRGVRELKIVVDALRVTTASALAMIDPQLTPLDGSLNTASPSASAKLFMHDPAFPQWMKDVQTMSAERQIEAVSKKLMELNPGFDGAIQNPYGGKNPRIENGGVVAVWVQCDHVQDISPVRAFSGLKNLSCWSSSPTISKLSDISPLQGLQLRQFNGSYTKISDLTPFQEMPLEILDLRETRIRNLSSLRGMPLRNLSIQLTKIDNLTPLEDCKTLENLELYYINVPPSSIAALQKALPNCKIKWDDPAKAKTPQPVATGTK
ncbi:MAG: hypothetical protein C0483_18165 [Pirellula sp.]|nr:hypothetical protein [Pirellula sp.]